MPRYRGHYPGRIRDMFVVAIEAFGGWALTKGLGALRGIYPRNADADQLFLGGEHFYRVAVGYCDHTPVNDILAEGVHGQ